MLRELDAGGVRLAPTAERLRKLLDRGSGDCCDAGQPAPRPLMPVPLPQTPPQPSHKTHHMI